MSNNQNTIVHAFQLILNRSDPIEDCCLHKLLIQFDIYITLPHCELMIASYILCLSYWGISFESLEIIKVRFLGSHHAKLSIVIRGQKYSYYTEEQLIPLNKRMNFAVRGEANINSLIENSRSILYHKSQNGSTELFRNTNQFWELTMWNTKLWCGPSLHMKVYRGYQRCSRSKLPTNCRFKNSPGSGLQTPWRPYGPYSKKR